MEAWILAYVLLVVTLSGIVRVVCGFGNALIAMPLLALVLDLTVVTPLVAIQSLLFSLFILARTHRSIHLGPAIRLFAWSLAGIPLGLLLLTGGLESFLKTGLGLIIAGYSVLCLAKRRPGHLQNDRFLPFFGLAGGVLGGAYNTNGPPIVIYGLMRGWDAPAFRATLQGYFLATGAIVSLAQGLAGLWTREVLAFLVQSMPAVLLSVWAGQLLAGRIPAGAMERAIHCILILAGGLLAARGLS